MTEAFGWIFVDFIPLLYEKKRVAKQLQIETWLDLSQLVRELGIEKLKKTDKRDRKPSYIV
ncbi:hypothetical protein CW707_01195 [Candidatus Bathyarchaeota archaeon]|nr:MAG: hypothetical protein CW707_01195 [Candidatus Bathyarchaeota archaeon]RLI18204.1 MAG: hypothetical protein DRO44_01770 [Candidatus Bathyarchaeota archaeon]HDD70369.1 hypothetical protein [Candidatus Bathyarchaeota archaeon]